MNPDSKFIPNSYSTPNAYVDQYMAFLTSDEWKVLSYMVRRIFGFQKRQDRISYRQLTDGIVTKEGERLDYGTGLGQAAVKSAIGGLVNFHLVNKDQDNDPKKNEGPMYSLNLDSSTVDFGGLTARREDLQRKNNEKIAKARQNLPPTVEQTPICQTEGGWVCQTEGGVGLSDRVHNIQGNTDLKTDTHATRVTVSPSDSDPFNLLSSGKEETESDKSESPGKKKNQNSAGLFPIASALAEVTGMDFAKNKPRLFREAKAYYKPGDEERIRQEYSAGGLWYTCDWRGQGGEKPTLAHVRETWGNLQPIPVRISKSQRKMRVYIGPDGEEMELPE